MVQCRVAQVAAPRFPPRPVQSAGHEKGEEMSATPTPIRRLLALAAAMFFVAVVAAVGAGPTSANPVNGSDANGTYLALGDSVAFGYVPSTALPPPNYLDAHSFVGYQVAQADSRGPTVRL